MGIDPYVFLDVDQEEYLIKVAMLRKALELRSEEIQTTARLIAVNLSHAL